MWFIFLQTSLHVLFINTCPYMWKPFHIVYHSALGALWKWVFQVHALQIPEVSGNLPFAFARGLKMKRFGTVWYCCAIHYGTKKCLGLGREATNDPSFCPENIKIDMWDMQHLWNTVFFSLKGRKKIWMISFCRWLQWLIPFNTRLRPLLPTCLQHLQLPGVC